MEAPSRHSLNELTASGEEQARAAAYTEALQSYTAALAIRSTHMPALIGNITSLIGLERYQEALELVEWGSSFTVHHELPALGAEALQGLNRSEEALKLIQRALWLAPHEARRHHLHGEILFALARDEEAAKSFETALEKITEARYKGLRESQDDVPVAVPEADDNVWRRQAQAAKERAERRKESLALLERQRLFHPEDIPFWVEVARELRELDCTPAADALEHGIAENAVGQVQMAAAADHLLHRVDPTMLRDHPEQALAIYDRVLEINPVRPEAAFGRAKVFFAQGRWTEALDMVDLIPESRTVAHSEGWFIRGRILRRAGRLEAALECYKRAVIYGPWVEEWRQEQADLLVQLGRGEEARPPLAAAELIAGLGLAGHARRTSAPDSYEEVLAHFERALALEPTLRFAQGEIAATLIDLGRPEEALARIDAAQAQAPQDAYFWTVRGAALAAAGRLEESLSAFAEAFTLAPTSISLTGKAKSLARLGRVEEALSAVEQAIELDDEDDAAWGLRSELLAQLGDTEKALAAMEVALEWEGLLTLEDHVDLVSKNLAVQATRFQQALDWDDRLDVYRAKAALQRQMGREEEAGSVEGDLARYAAEPHQQAGQQYLSQGRYAEAVAEFDLVLSVAPRWGEVWLAKGDALLAFGKVDEALLAFGQAMQNAVDSLREVYNRANTFTNQQQYARAIPLADAALEALPSLRQQWPRGAQISANHMQALLLKLKGKVLSETNQYEQALDNLNRALELAPNLQTGWRQRGRVHAQMQRWQESASDFEHALDLDASSSYDWHSRAYALYKCERYEEALVAIERAIDLDPSPPIVGTKGQIYLRMGQFEPALVWLDRALDLDPSDREHWRDKADALRHLGRLEEAEVAVRHAAATRS